MKSKPKVILITGVSKGLGRALVDQFVRLDHVVVGCARSAAQIQQLQKTYTAPHSFAVVDVADDSAVKKWADQVLNEHPAPDLLINNAAIINRNAPLWCLGDQEFSEVIDVNVKGPTNVIRHFLPAMVKQSRGVVVNFSSGWGRSADAEVAPYCASKYAIEGLTQALAQELPAGMAAVPLNPGIIDTEMLRSCFGGSASSYPTPEEWAQRAAPYLLALGAKDNGQSLSVP
ncbi:MAG: SDR family oxidoreductase [Limisphaerales bacterium]